MKEKLIIGMPAGSLADPKRGGNLVTLLKAAGFPTKGYEDGGPTSFPLHSMFFGWDGRPQEFGAQLALHEVDIAIGGDDWITERVLEYRYEYGQDITLNRTLSLDRGKVRIVVVNAPLPEGKVFDAWLADLLKKRMIIRVVSEMPYLAIDWFRKKKNYLGFGDEWDEYSVQKYNTPSKIESGLVVYESWGKTEAKVLNGSVDFGFEITQTGSAIRNYGLHISEEVMISETGIWTDPKLRQNPVKYDLARMFLLNIFGAVFAENKVLILFNARKDAVEPIIRYLGTNGLFGDEPTMNEGINFTEFSIQMSTSDIQLPLAQVRYQLARLGATHIETVPLDSCIPGLNAIDF
jgi:ATP phosphoribosyltransferase